MAEIKFHYSNTLPSNPESTELYFIKNNNKGLLYRGSELIAETSGEELERLASTTADALKIIQDNYETKQGATEKLNSAKQYTDDEIQNIKDNLKGGAYRDIDNALSTLSTNPVENKVITDWLKNNVKNYKLIVDTDGDAILQDSEVSLAAVDPDWDDGLVYYINGHPLAVDWENVTNPPSATTSKNGLMSMDDKAKVDSLNIAYGTCSTAANVAEKVVTLTNSPGWELKTGSLITVKFSNTNTAEAPKLNVNGKGAKSIYYNNAVYTSSSSYGGYANRHITYQYDGTNWVFISWGYDTNSDTKVNTKLATTSKAYLLGTTTTPTSSTKAVTSVADTGVYLGTTAGQLVATTFKGNLEGNAASATSDENDNNIINTYETKKDASAKLSTATKYADNTLTEAKEHSDTNLSAAKTYADTKVAGIVNSAPETLNTLNELAAALGNDENFSTTMANLIGTKLPLAGGTMNAGAAIKWGAKNNLTPYIGHCTSSNDGTFVVGSLKGTVWNTGLAIGGGSGNLLWKGAEVATIDTTKLTNYLPLTGGNMAGGHIYLTGSQATSSTGNTTQIVFGKSNDQHVALSSNNNALVINPSTTETSNTTDGASQIVLYLNKASSFPKGISGNLSGNASTATQFASDTTVSATGDATGTSAASKRGWSIPLTLADSGVTAGSYGPSANKSPGHGSTFSVPYLEVDAKGRVIAASTKTITLPTYGVATSSALGLVKSGTDITVDSSGNVSVVDGSHNHSASNITSGTLSSDRLSTIPISKGGTGATTAANALTNLGAAPIANGTYVVTAASTDGATYTATVPSITSLTAGASFIMIPNKQSTTKTPTLNVNNLGAKNIKRNTAGIMYSGLTTGGYIASWLIANEPIEVIYNGAEWIVKNNSQPSASDLYGTVPIKSGGTGATTAAGVLTNLGLTATATELNYCDGVTSNIQTQINNLTSQLNTYISDILGGVS